eukprot:g2403.t1
MAPKTAYLSDLIGSTKEVDPSLKSSKKLPLVSIEFYPPKTKPGISTLFKNLDRLKSYRPIFADMTWNAGGSSSDLTMELCQRMKNDYGVVPNMHLTCTNVDARKIKQALDDAKKEGICNILALRGDPPRGQEKWEASDLAFTCALDLVKHIRAQYGDYFHITVAGYPEGHPNTMSEVQTLEGLSPTELQRYSVMYHKDEDGKEDRSKVTGYLVCRDADYQKELIYLKQKVDAGASCIITQMFFDANIFIQFVKDCRAIGISVPILPGIMLIGNIGGFRRMTGMCKTRVPQILEDSLNALEKKFKGADSDDIQKKALAEAVKTYGIEFGTKICQQLIDANVTPGLHFYTLNRAQMTISILEKLGYEPTSPQDESVSKPDEGKSKENGAIEEVKGDL